MKRRNDRYHRPYFPFGFFWLGLLMTMLFGWHVILIPFFMLVFWSMWIRVSQEYELEPVEVEKRKRKPKNDEWNDVEFL